jgi:hypothetical protein
LNTSGTCVDAGAVQTNYSIAFTTPPPAEAVVNLPFTPAPVIGLLESGVPLSLNSGTVVMSDSSGQLAGALSKSLNAGSAIFNNLTVPSLNSGDTLTATLLLNSPVITNVQAATTTDIVEPTPATLTPSTGTLSPSQLFSWNNGVGPVDFELLLGTTGVGASDLYSSGITKATSVTVSIPSSGVTVYATLKQLINGTWQASHCTLTESGSPTLATLTPSTGTLSPSQTFTWNNGIGPVDFFLSLGTTGAGSSDLYSSGITKATSATVSIPSNGVNVYATFRQLISGTWQVTRYTFIEP